MNDLSDKDLLSRELHDRSHDVGGHPIGIGTVKQSARRIQRTRRIVGGAVAAAVLAVAVPAGLAIGGGSNQGLHEPVAPNPHPSVTKTATPRPDGSYLLTTSDLARGEDPQVPYIAGVDRQLVTPGGTTDLPATFQMLTPFQDGWLGITAERGWQTVVLDQDLNVVEKTPGGPVLALNADRSQVAYVTTDGSGRTVLASAPTDGFDVMTWPMPPGREVSPVGFVAPGTVVYKTDGEQPVIAMADGTGRLTELEGFLNVSDASEANGLVAGQLTYDPLDGSCYGVMRPAQSTTETVWETCDYQLGRFSPDGRYVLGGATDHDGMGSPILAILDATNGEPVVEFRPARNQLVAVNQWAWEDSDSVIAIVYDGKWRILRASTSGALEAASDERPGEDLDIPYWFAEVPRP